MSYKARKAELDKIKNEIRKERIKKGLCRICEKPIYLSLFCEKHYDLQLVSQRRARTKIRLQRKKENKCQWCGLDLSRCNRDNMSICVSCAETKSQYNHLSWERY